jgi:hypothetical protein
MLPAAEVAKHIQDVPAQAPRLQDGEDAAAATPTRLAPEQLDSVKAGQLPALVR